MPHGSKGERITADFMSPFRLYRTVTTSDVGPPNPITQIIYDFVGGVAETPPAMLVSISATRNKMAVIPKLTGGTGGITLTFWQEVSDGSAAGVAGAWVAVLTSTLLTNMQIARFGGFFWGRYKISVTIETDGVFELYLSTSENTGAID